MSEAASPPNPSSFTRALAFRVGSVLVAFAVVLWGLVSWVEAEKEIRVLCSMAAPGKTRAGVERMFATGNFLRTNSAPHPDGEALVVKSRANGGLSQCTVALSGGIVTSNVFEERVRLGQVAAGAALAGLGWLAVLQLLLASGASLGRMAWGGTHERLPIRLRVGSAVSAAVMVLAAVCVVELAEMAEITGNPGLVWSGLAVLTLVMAMSTFANAASSSPVERRTGTPVAFLLTCAFVVLLLGR